PLQPTSLEPEKILVVGERSGVLAGVASYDARRWWVVWESRQAVSREKVYATLAAGAVEDVAGNELAAPVSFAFGVR
ncbi:MAG: hypothetical protein N2447_09725, partial [Thermoanaerobaculum sp.]|nr:hypothetical protein [Thermoanaerobaculum sp.]